MTRIFITGIAGFLGGHLWRDAMERGWFVSGQDLKSAPTMGAFYQVDIHDRTSLQHALTEARPDVVFHLAGLIKSGNPESLYTTNVLGTVSLFDAIMESGTRPMVVVASSSAVYGSGFGGRPISERFSLHPVTHYAVSKLAQEIAALHYFNAFDLPVIIIRMFNLLGPGQSPDLACSAFAHQIALAEVNGSNEIVTGDLSTYRDFVDVRDAVRAFTLLAERGKTGQVYNVCSGHAVLIRKCLDEMLSMSPRQLKVREDAGRVQKNDVPIQVGNAQKLNQVTGWYPQISLRQSLADLLEHWRQRVKPGLE